MEKSSRPTRSPPMLMVKMPSSTTTTCAAAGAAKQSNGAIQATERRSEGEDIPEMYPRRPARSRRGRGDGYNPACPPPPVPSSV